MNPTRLLRSALLPLTVLALTGSARGQITADWFLTYVDGIEFGPRALAVDSAGASYVVSKIENATDDVALTKFDADGHFVWQSVHAGPNGQDVALTVVLAADESAVYAVGRSSVPGFGNSDYAIVRYDAVTGVQQWVRYYDGPASGIDDPRAAAAMPDGGIVVTGLFWNDDERSDYGTVRYDADGNAVWDATYGDNGPFLFNDDRGEHVTVTADGDVVVTGTARPASGGNDIVSFRYDGMTGAMEWMARYSTSANESVDDIAMTPDGDVIVFGSDPFGWDRQWLVIRYDGATGVEEWTTLYDPGADESPRAVTVDGAGDIYVTGATDPDGNDSNANQNLIVIALAGPTGAVRWLVEFGSEGFSEADYGLDLAIDDDGDLVVVGLSRSQFIVQNPFDADAIVLKYDRNTGDQLDLAVVDSTEEGGPTRTDSFFDLGFDAQGRLYAMGLSSGDVGVEDRLLLARFTDEQGNVADIDGDGSVGVNDLVAVILAWGTCGQCPEDLDGNGVVDVADMVIVITSWG